MIIIINGTLGDDALYGSAADDIILGKDGNDVIYAYAGNDIVSGAGRDDYLSGWTGNDQLFGGTGKDILLGGAGAESFWWYAPNESGAGAGNRDIIMDFQVGVDTLHLAGFHITAQDIHMTSFQGGASTMLGIDFDHDGHSDCEIQLNKVAFGTLSAADTIL